MKKDNIIVIKSFQYSVRIVKLYVYLQKSGVEKKLCTQLLRSGTSIGANVGEAMGASSINEFIYKLQIAYRESRETSYWLRLMKVTGLIREKLADSFIHDCNELEKILVSIISSSKQGKSK